MKFSPKNKKGYPGAGRKGKIGEKVDEMSLKADYFDSLVDGKLLINFRDTEKK